jgi:hypothetical protein
MTMIKDITQLKGYLPFLLNRDENGPTLAWSDFTNVPLEDPFFINGIMGRLFLPDPRFALSPLPVLLQAEEVLDGLKPDGFVFHMSACGSTLLMNVLRALPGMISLGEPNVLFNILTLSGAQSEDSVIELFRNCVIALGQRRLGDERHYVIKFGSATTVFLPLIVRAFPDVPRVFLYRDPVEVLVSNMKNPHQEWLFLPEVTGTDQITITEVNTPLETCALALKRTIEAFLDHGVGSHLIANYTQFSPALIRSILDLFRIQVTQAEFDKMMSAASDGHAHNQQVPFLPDAEDKQGKASPKLRQTAAKYLGDLYDRLESMRVHLDPA